ncbi:hypothetical protein EAI_09179 [Harpegnathos saltator]|uniref:Uncharacterized protein n=1 Tax=Harpegnathos saltator TaxID=610380 RepID=E2BFK5_HARSA|nr:hypothetical protein EAI_09179 [Harpegnathos saltator]
MSKDNVMYQDKSESKEEEDKQLMDINDDLADIAKDELQSPNLELSDQQPIIEEIEDKETGTEEIIEGDKDAPLLSGEGPRRRKPNKE